MPVVNSFKFGGGSLSALQFAGTGYLSAGTLGTFGSNLASGFSVRFVLNTTSTAQTDLFGSMNDGFTTYVRGIMNRDGPGSLGLLIRNDNDNDLVCALSSDLGILDGEDHLIEMVAVPSTSNAAIYVDHVLVGTATTTGATGSFSNFQYPFYFAGTNNRGALLNPGSLTIDDIHVSSNALGPVVTYALEEGAGSSVADTSGNGYTGTVTNGTWVAGLSAPDAPAPGTPNAFADPANYQTIRSESGSSLTGWTVSGGVTTDGTEIHLNGASRTAQLPVSFPSDKPYVAEIEFRLGNTGTATSLKLTIGTTRLVQLTLAGAAADLYNTAGLQSSTTIQSVTSTSRLFLWHNPVTGKGRVFIFDDGTSNLRFLGEVNQTGTATHLYFNNGGASSNSLFIRNIKCYPAYGIWVGDSRAAGHNSYDPYPSFYAGQDPVTFSPADYLDSELGVRGVNLGRGSASYPFTLGVLPNLLKLEPKVVVLDTNNINGLSAAAVRDYVSQMLTLAHDAGAAVVIMDFTPNGTSAPASINTELADLAQSTGYPFVETYDTLRGGSGVALVAPYNDDGVHLTAAGYAVRGEGAAAAISAA